MTQPLVSVVLLSYNRPHYLEQSLRSLSKQTYPRLQVIVIDNPSPQSPAIRRLLADHPEVHFFPMSQNAGYAGGMNEGICRAAGEYIYLTEDDMLTAPEAIGEMVAYMRRDPQAAIVSGVHHDDRGALIHAGGFITLGSTYSQFLIGRDTPVPPLLHGPFCATYATGAMMMLRRSVIEELGAFREDFFMYFEDVELCARYLRSGKTVVIVPTARAETFADSYAGRPSPAVEFHKFKNLLTVNLLHAPAKVLPEFLARYAGLNLLRSLRAGRRLALEHLRANLWVAARLPRLLRQRRSFASRHGGSRSIAKFPRQQSERV